MISRAVDLWPVRLTVNGRPHELALPAHALLLDVLRDRLDLKGAKRSCDSQVCGACTVLVDGLAVSTCTFLAVEADGREVLTVEGLADGERLHPLQQAFIDHGAVQCGFCTSGMLLTAKALLDEEPAPTPERLAHALRGSLCRCTGYRRILDAILAVASAAAGGTGPAGPAPADSGVHAEITSVTGPAAGAVSRRAPALTSPPETTPAAAPAGGLAPHGAAPMASRPDITAPGEPAEGAASRAAAARARPSGSE